MSSALSWFQQKKRRVKETLLQAIGSHEASYDNSFEHELKMFKSQVDDINELREAMELWSATMENMCSANSILADAFNSYFKKTLQNKEKENETKEKEIKVEEDNIHITEELTKIRNAANKFQIEIRKYNDTIKTNITRVFNEKCIIPTTEVLSIKQTIDHLISQRQGLKLDFDNYTAKLQTEEVREDEERHKRNQIKLQKATNELDNITQSIFECMDEFDSSKPNLLSTEFASAFACIYHFSSSSSCIMAKLLAFIPMAASTLATLYEADNASYNDVKNLKHPDKPLKETVSPYDFTSIFRRTPPPIPSEDVNSHSNSLLTSVMHTLSLEDNSSQSNAPIKENSIHHIKEETLVASKPPEKPVKNTSLLNTKASNDNLQELDESSSTLDATETSPTRDRRSSLTKQKAITDMSADIDDDFEIDNEGSVSGKISNSEKNYK